MVLTCVQRHLIRKLTDSYWYMHTYPAYLDHTSFTPCGFSPTTSTTYRCTLPRLSLPSRLETHWYTYQSCLPFPYPFKFSTGGPPAYGRHPRIGVCPITQCVFELDPSQFHVPGIEILQVWLYPCIILFESMMKMDSFTADTNAIPTSTLYYASRYVWSMEGISQTIMGG